MALDISKITDRSVANVLASLDVGKGAIASIIGVNANATGDNLLTMSLPAGKTTYIITDIYVIQTAPSTPYGSYFVLSTLRTAASGGGTNIATVNPSFSGTILNMTHAGGVGSSDANAYNNSTLYWNISVAQGAALTLNMYLVGMSLF